ncbi:MAG: hypothetical protein ACQETB_05555 [Halobacteriota archaeon]
MAILPQQTFVGITLMLIATILFVPGLASGTTTLGVIGLVAAALLLTVGTLLVGTSEGGRPV